MTRDEGGTQHSGHGDTTVGYGRSYCYGYTDLALEAGGVVGRASHDLAPWFYETDYFVRAQLGIPTGSLRVQLDAYYAGAFGGEQDNDHHFSASAGIRGYGVGPKDSFFPIEWGLDLVREDNLSSREEWFVYASARKRLLGAYLFMTIGEGLDRDDDTRAFEIGIELPF